MLGPNVVVLVHVYDQVDLLEPFAAWYTEMGVRRLIVQDMGSTDGSKDVLTQLSKQYPLDWYSLDDLNLLNHANGNTGDNMAAMARSHYAPEWMMMCDADEFLCFDEGSLGDLLASAARRDATVLTVPCCNMTGHPPGRDNEALLSLTTRIIRPYQESYEEQLSRQVPVPFIFVKHQPKSIVLASAFSSYKPGSHGSNVSSGNEWPVTEAHFKHYPMRSYSTFQKKVSNVAHFLEINRHLPEWWGWHWRRWIDLEITNDLEADYNRQFLNDTDQLKFVENGTCQVDESVASWMIRRSSATSGDNKKGLSSDEGLAARLAYLEKDNLSLQERLDHWADRASHLETEAVRLQARTAYLCELLSDLKVWDRARLL